MIAVKNSLVAADFGEAADNALTYGRALARAFGATLHVLHVTNDIYMQTLGSDAHSGTLYTDIQRDVEAAARARLHQLVIDNDPNPLAMRTVVVTSNVPADTIVAYAKDAGVDLVVLGTHGRGAVARLLVGSVAERVVRTAPCPVLTVRHPEHEFVTPDTLAAVART